MKNRHFPLFVESEGRSVIVLGGGNITLRRVKTLAGFDFDITVVSTGILPELRDMADKGEITYIEDAYNETYLDGGYFMVLACTDSREVNQSIGRAAKERNQFVSVCDCRDECNFFFPAVAVNSHLTMGLVGDGTSHDETKRAAAELRKIIEERGNSDEN